MTGPIGYYVHHHGDGHRQRAMAIAQAAPPGHFTLIGTGLAGRTRDLPFVDLPDDRLTDGCAFDGHDDAPDRLESLHYAPVHHEGIRSRAALLTDWIAQMRPSLMVVDVSAEIAMLARLSATPTVYVRLGGLRNDFAHLEAFRGATAILAPFHRGLDDPEMPEWVRARTRFCPGLISASRPGEPTRQDTILVVYGKGGSGGDGDALAQAALACPGWQWRVIGPVSHPRSSPENLTILGWVEDAEGEIARAGVVAWVELRMRLAVL